MWNPIYFILQIIYKSVELLKSYNDFTINCSLICFFILKSICAMNYHFYRDDMRYRFYRDDLASISTFSVVHQENKQKIWFLREIYCK
jgi:hypothetical protein